MAAELDPDLKVTGPRSAVRALQHAAVRKQHTRALKHRRTHAVAVVVPCAQTKPYRQSRSHAIGYLPAVEGKDVDLFAFSDLSGIIPYAWSDRYPNAHYEFAPKHVTGQAREILVERVAEWLASRGTRYERVYLALPASYLKLICEALALVDDPPALYDVSISECRRIRRCPKTHFRATSSAYVQYLRETIEA